MGRGAGENQGEPRAVWNGAVGMTIRNKPQNNKTEARKWVEAEKIFSALEALGYEIIESCETFNSSPYAGAPVVRKVW